VDIGIINPDNDKEYILGILVDGDNYNHINTTNDRELLAPNVLKGLGWNIYRIWTLDWLKNKDKCIQEIKQLLKDIQENKLQKPVVEVSETPLMALPKVNELVIEKVTSNFKIPYQAADITPIAFANAESIYYPVNRTVIIKQMK